MEEIVNFTTNFGILLIFLIILSLFRNDWVLNERTKLLNLDFNKYKKLEDYNTMFLKFWIWNIEKFIKDENNS